MLPRSTKQKLRKFGELGSSELDDSEEPENLWINFRTKILKATESGLRSTPRTSKCFLTKETLSNIDVSRKGGLETITGQYLNLKREAVPAVKRFQKAHPM